MRSQMVTRFLRVGSAKPPLLKVHASTLLITWILHFHPSSNHIMSNITSFGDGITIEWIGQSDESSPVDEFEGSLVDAFDGSPVDDFGDPQTDLRRAIMEIQNDAGLSSPDKARKMQVSEQPRRRAHLRDSSDGCKQELMSSQWKPVETSEFINKLSDKRSNFETVTDADKTETFYVSVIVKFGCHLVSCLHCTGSLERHPWVLSLPTVCQDSGAVLWALGRMSFLSRRGVGSQGRKVRAK